MSRFRLEKVTMQNGDGSEGLYDVLVDKLSEGTVEGPFGRARIAHGFIRCRGQHYVGRAGENSALYWGNADDIYYEPCSMFDGLWGTAGPGSRGIHHYITKDSGTGLIWRELEKFANENNIEPI